MELRTGDWSILLLVLNTQQCCLKRMSLLCLSSSLLGVHSEPSTCHLLCGQDQLFFCIKSTRIQLIITQQSRDEVTGFSGPFLALFVLCHRNTSPERWNTLYLRVFTLKEAQAASPPPLPFRLTIPVDVPLKWERVPNESIKF
jgi:hypothetical protein